MKKNPQGKNANLNLVFIVFFAIFLACGSISPVFAAESNNGNIEVVLVNTKDKKLVNRARKNKVKAINFLYRKERDAALKKFKDNISSVVSKGDRIEAKREMNSAIKIAKAARDNGLQAAKREFRG
jgi:hypothetical protein